MAYPFLSTYIGNTFLEAASNMNYEGQSLLFNFLRFITAALLLFAPTTAMGGTLPTLSRFFVESLSETRKEVGSLYFLNSFGAVVGVVFAGFILIKDFGLNVTIYSTATLNILAGFIGLFIAVRYSKSIGSERNFSIEEKGTSKTEVPPRMGRLVILVAGLSGMAALLYEMVWTRLLINFFGSSTYAFSIMLLSFISGITIGGLIISQKFLNRFDKINLLAFCQAAIGLFIIVILLLYDRLPYYLWNISALFSKSYEAFGIFTFIEFAICFLIMLPPTLFMGMTLPLATEIVAGMDKKVGASVGVVFSINTLGTVAGVILTGLIFIPVWGIKVSFEIGIALNLLSFLIIFVSAGNTTHLKKFIYASAPIALFVLYLIFFPGWNTASMLSGVFKSFGQNPPKTFKQFLDRYSNEKVIFYKEGASANVAVAQLVSNPNDKRLIINGKPDASTYYDMPTQVLLGQIPMLLHPNPQNVFVVGFGSGTTIGSILTHPVKNVICAEISKEVINAAKFFSNENRDCVNDARLNLINEDALTLLKLSKNKFDVIVSEPSNPWIAGIGNLFSQEYFQTCLSKLNDDGIMVQWFHLYEADNDVVRLVINTFSSVFPYAQIWTSVANDIMLVGTKKEMKINFSGLAEKFQQPSVKEDLHRIGIDNPFTFLLCQLVSPMGFYLMSEKNPVNTEIHPLLEFLAPRAFYVGKPADYIYRFDEKFDTLGNSIMVKNYIRSYPPTKEELTNAILYQQNKSKNIRLAFGLSQFLKSKFPNDLNSTVLFTSAQKQIALNNPELYSLKDAINKVPDTSQAAKDYYNSSIMEKVNSTFFMHVVSIKNDADFFIKTAKLDTLSILKTYLQVAKDYFQNSEYANARITCSYIEKILSKSPRYSRVFPIDDYYYMYAVTSLEAKQMDKVFIYYLSLINYNPNHKDLHRLRALVSWDLKFNK